MLASFLGYSPEIIQAVADHPLARVPLNRLGFRLAGFGLLAAEFLAVFVGAFATWRLSKEREREIMGTDGQRGT